MKKGKLKQLLKKIKPAEWFKDCPVYIAPMPHSPMCDTFFDIPGHIFWPDRDPRSRKPDRENW